MRAGIPTLSEEGGAERGGAYNSVRGNKVIEFSKRLNNTNLSPLRSGNVSIRAKKDDVDGFIGGLLKNEASVNLFWTK